MRLANIPSKIAVFHFDWQTSQYRLLDWASPVRTVLINSKSKDALAYAGNAASSLSVLAVGCFALSRGLTLEGLMVSYFFAQFDEV